MIEVDIYKATGWSWSLKRNPDERCDSVDVRNAKEEDASLFLCLLTLLLQILSLLEQNDLHSLVSYFKFSFYALLYSRCISKQIISLDL